MQLSRVLSGSLQTNATPGSTWNLAKSRPEAFVVGVDKSFARLTRNAAFRGRDTNEGWGSEMERGQGAFGAGTLESTEESEPPPARDNMILVRANCIDFWRLIWESGLAVGKQLQKIACELYVRVCVWPGVRETLTALIPACMRTCVHAIVPESHTLLYPNPYPKPKQHMLRWHGSPSFPILLYMGAPIEVRAVNVRPLTPSPAEALVRTLHLCVCARMYTRMNIVAYA